MEYYFERAAKQCLPMPERLTLPEQAVYQAISALSARYRCGLITPEQAVKEKKMIDAAYTNQVVREAFITWCSSLHQRVELAAAAYRKDRTLEHADAVLDTIDGLLR